MKPLFHADFHGEVIIALQTFFVAVLVVLLIVATLRGHHHTPVEIYLVIFAAIYWIFPLTLGGSLSLYRSESILLPVAILGRRFPTVILIALAFIALLLFPLMGLLFFRGTLV